VREREKLELAAPRLRQANVDDAAALAGHEGHGLGGRELGRHDDVALDLVAGAVRDDDEAAGAHVLDRRLGVARPRHRALLVVRLHRQARA